MESIEIKMSAEETVKTAEKPAPPLSDQEVRQGFAQTQQQVGALVKTFRHNSQVVQQGFYANDIWMETVRSMLSDIAATQKLICDAQGIETVWPANEEGVIDAQSYWEKAQENIKAQMDEARKKAEAQGSAQKPLVERAADEETVEFGGDYGSE